MESYSLSSGLGHCNSTTPQRCTRWEAAACVVCSKVRRWTHGIFCANYGLTKMWCGGCYTSAPHPDFFTAEPDNLFSDEDDENRLVSGWKPKNSDKGRYRQARNDPDNLFSDEDDENRLVSGWKPKNSDKGRYRQARNGDDLLITFECDYCVFSKVHEHAPDESLAINSFGMACIRRIILDTFWS